MGAPRHFVLTGGATVAELLDRAAAHGPAGRVVVDRAPHPSGCYGVVEIKIHNPTGAAGGEPAAPPASGGEP